MRTLEQWGIGEQIQQLKAELGVLVEMADQVEAEYRRVRKVDADGERAEVEPATKAILERVLPLAGLLASPISEPRKAAMRIHALCHSINEGLFWREQNQREADREEEARQARAAAYQAQEAAEEAERERKRQGLLPGQRLTPPRPRVGRSGGS